MSRSELPIRRRRTQFGYGRVLVDATLSAAGAALAVLTLVRGDWATAFIATLIAIAMAFDARRTWVVRRGH